MLDYELKVHPSKAGLKREDQLAWKIAGVAADRVAVPRDVAGMIPNINQSPIKERRRSIGSYRFKGRRQLTSSAKLQHVIGLGPLLGFDPWVGLLARTPRCFNPRYSDTSFYNSTAHFTYGYPERALEWQI